MTLKKDRTLVPAVDSAIAVIDLISASSFPLTLSEICRQTDIPAASAHRIINSLLHHQLIALDPRRKRSYNVGSRIFEIASTIFSKQSLIPFFYPIAEILKNEIHQPIFLSVPVGNQMVVVSKVEPSVSSAFEIYIGQTNSMHTSAAGKVILSMHTDEFRENYFQTESEAEKLNSFMEENLLEELGRAHRLGYAVSNGEFEGLINTIAAPVLNLRNEPVAAISIAVKSGEFSPAEARQYSKNLVQAARQLSSRIV